MTAKGQFQVDFLRSVVTNGGQIESVRFSLQRGPLEFPEPIYSLTLEQREVRSLQELPWTPELETYLLFELQRRVDREDEEAERFAAILLNNIETAAERHGKDYAHAILVALLRERGDSRLMPLLDRATPARPSASGQHHAACTAFLRDSIDGLQSSASVNLGYSPEQALALMHEALAIVLDETFHLSGADLLFPKHA